MILELSVENIAVIEKAQIELGPGFTVLTGETGAGKSLLVDAIALALGGRADQDLLRAGATKGPVHLVADISQNSVALAWCAEMGIGLEDGKVYVTREISAEGRNVSRIQGKSQPVSAVRELGALLVDLHGQHDHQALLDPERHVDYLDLWIGDSARRLLAQIEEAVEQWSEKKSALESLMKGMRDREQRLDLLRFQVNEIESLGVREGEIAELEASLSRLQNVERLAAGAFTALGAMSEEEGSALERLGMAASTLDHLRRLDPSLEEVAEPVQSALAALEEGARALRRYADQLESDPERLEETAARLDQLKRLLRKYGENEAAVIAHGQRAAEELALLEDAEASAEELEEAVRQRRANVILLCEQLTKVRKERAADFASQVQAEIRELAMEKAHFSVEILPKEPDARGGDSVQFLFSANPGEPQRGLGKIASGGEMSRVMLALKVVLAGKAGVPTLIFDEIDTGLSGRAAAIVARKLQEIAAFYQVVSISHLPQLAGRADVHFKIEKEEEAGRTFTRVRQLTEAERVEEVARMLAGEQIGEMALANARELLSGRR